MPHLRFRAIPESIVQEFSKSLVARLCELMNCPEEDMTFEYIPSNFYRAGKIEQAYPFVEVLWFDRGPQVQDQVAVYLTSEIQNSMELADTAVIFTALDPQKYYDNGKHYG